MSTTSWAGRSAAANWLAYPAPSVARVRPWWLATICPVVIGCPWLDVHRIEDGEALMRVLVDATVPAYVFGHIHQEADVALPTRLLGTPSTCFQFATDTAEFAVDNAKPGYRWLHLAEDGSVATEVHRIVDFPLAINLMDRGHR